MDHEYKRDGMANIHVAFEPLTGRRAVEVTERRRAKEFAEAMRPEDVKALTVPR